MAACDVIAAGCACKGVSGAGSNSVGPRGAIHWTEALARKREARGAGVVGIKDMLPGDLAMHTTMLNSWESVPEAAWPAGTVAKLAEPYTVDRGPYATDAQVTRFVKKASGRWFSDPGADVSFASLFEVAGRAVIAEVVTPYGETNPQVPAKPAPDGTEPNEAQARADVDVDEAGDAQDALGRATDDAGLPVQDGYSESDAVLSRKALLIGGGVVGLLALGAVGWWLFK